MPTFSQSSPSMSSSSSQSNWRLKASFFLRAIGLKRGFRRTGPATLMNIFVAAGVGVISGRYIFKDPLDNYWKEQRLKEGGGEQSSSTKETTSPSLDK